jgi:photosystem II stability/assembly factor-like uncharacterized protein
MTVPDWVLPGGYTFTDHAGVYKSTDGGQTWANILTTSNDAVPSRMHPDNHNLLFVSALSDGFFVSDKRRQQLDEHRHWLDSRNPTSVWGAGSKYTLARRLWGVRR